MQSGSCYSRPLAQTESASSAFATAAGCTNAATVLPCLRGKTAAQLLDASTGFSPTLTSGTSVLPLPTLTAVQQGRFARVPIVNGSNRDEGRTFAQGDIGCDAGAVRRLGAEHFRRQRGRRPRPLPRGRRTPTGSPPPTWSAPS